MTLSKRLRDFRMDRTISVGLVHPAAPAWRARTPRIPILMYHGIRECTGCAHPYYEPHTTPRAFEAQMKYLQRSGYRTLNPGEALQALVAGRVPSKAVAITFDDGYRDFYTSAFPILASYGLLATLYVVSGFAENPRLAPAGERYLSWAEILQLHANAIHIGSHSVTHAYLRQQSPDQIDRELLVSKQSIEDVLGCAIESFAYPYSFPEQDREFTLRIRERLCAFGYQNAVSTILGTTSSRTDPFLLPRLPVNLYDDLSLFAAKLEGAYDWMHAAQLLHKRLATAPKEAQVRRAVPAEL
jgi:peptidoglycan/xylan/chitin deacetylase (PgdA/CDA1 family)